MEFSEIDLKLKFNKVYRQIRKLVKGLAVFIIMILYFALSLKFKFLKINYVFSDNLLIVCLNRLYSIIYIYSWKESNITHRS